MRLPATPGRVRILDVIVGTPGDRRSHKQRYAHLYVRVCKHDKMSLELLLRNLLRFEVLFADDTAIQLIQPIERVPAAFASSAGARPSTSMAQQTTTSTQRVVVDFTPRTVTNTWLELLPLVPDKRNRVQNHKEPERPRGRSKAQKITRETKISIMAFLLFYGGGEDNGSA